MNGNIFMLRVGNMNEKNVSSWYISVVETQRMKTTAKRWVIHTGYIS